MDINDYFNDFLLSMLNSENGKLIAELRYEWKKYCNTPVIKPIEDKEPTAFKWSDELVAQCHEYIKKDTAGILTPYGVRQNIKYFKESKQLSQSIPAGTGTANETINEEKKDWEIEKWQTRGGATFIKNEGFLRLNEDIILSVRRLSDNEVFSVGDLVCWGDDRDYRDTIKSFSVVNGSLFFGNDIIDDFPFKDVWRLEKIIPTANDVVNEVKTEAQGWDDIVEGKRNWHSFQSQKLYPDNPVLDRQYTTKEINDYMNKNSREINEKMSSPATDRQDKKERIEVESNYLHSNGVTMVIDFTKKFPENSWHKIKQAIEEVLNPTEFPTEEVKRLTEQYKNMTAHLRTKIYTEEDLKKAFDNAHLMKGDRYVYNTFEDYKNSLK